MLRTGREDMCSCQMNGDGKNGCAGLFLWLCSLCSQCLKAAVIQIHRTLMGLMYIIYGLIREDYFSLSFLFNPYWRIIWILNPQKTRALVRQWHNQYDYKHNHHHFLLFHSVICHLLKGFPDVYVQTLLILMIQYEQPHKLQHLLALLFEKMNWNIYSSD